MRTCMSSPLWSWVLPDRRDPDRVPHGKIPSAERTSATTGATSSAPPTCCGRARHQGVRRLHDPGRGEGLHADADHLVRLPQLDLQVAAGISAVLGHDFPVYIDFQRWPRRRGLASASTRRWRCRWPIGMVAVGIFIVLALRYMSVMSMVTVPGGAARPAAARHLPRQRRFQLHKAIFGAFATFSVLITHIPNIRRLIRGTEPKIGESERRPVGARGRARPT